jgi:hypothetical protein
MKIPWPTAVIDDWADYVSGAGKLLDLVEEKIDASEAAASKDWGANRGIQEAELLGLRSRLADARRDLDVLARTPKSGRAALRGQVDDDIRALEKAVRAPQPASR